MKKIRFYQVIIFLFYVLFFVLLLKNSFSGLDPDFGWHLKMGEDISLLKEVNYENYYNFIFPATDNYWLNHEWLSDFLLYQGYSNFGYIFINIVFAFIIVFSIFLLNNFISKNISKEKRFLLLLLPLELIGLRASLPHLGIRVQELSVLFLVLLFIIIYKFEKDALNNKKKYWKILFFLIPFMCLWANLHAGFLLGISLLFFYFGVKLIEKIISNHPHCFIYKFLSSFLSFKNTLPIKKLKIFFIFSIMAATSTIINPYGLKLFELLFQYKNTSYLKLIMEWFPQYYFPFLYWQMIYIGIILTLLIVSILNSQKKEKKILTPWNLSISLLFIILALKSKRHFPLLFVSTFPLLAEILFADFGILFKKSSTKIKKVTNILIRAYLLLCFFSVIILTTILINFTNKPFTSFCFDYPCAAIKFLKNKPELKNSRLFNKYSWGGFLINQYPEQKIFIDGRQPQKPFKNHSYLDEYMLFYQDNKEQTEEKIKEYDINLFLIDKNSLVKLSWVDKNIFSLKNEDYKIDSKLIKFLETNDNWEKIYEDKISLIFKKK